MKLNIDQAKQAIADTVLKKQYHPDYTETVEYAAQMARWNTGKNIEVDLRRFVPREDEEAFKQRCNLTETITKSLIASVMKPYKTVLTSNRVIKRIKPKVRRDIKSVTKIQDVFDAFYGSDDYDAGLDYWLKTRFYELTRIDPNAFIVIEFDQQTFKPYPFEVTSDMAINFDIENNNIDWLLCMQPATFYNALDKKEPTPGKRYTFYGDKFSLVYQQTSKNKDIAKYQRPNKQSEFITVGEELAFWVNKYDNVFKDVPAFRVGYVRDMSTDGRTYVTPFDDASPYINKSIQTVSQLDITTATNVFPKEYAYVTNCPGETTEENPDGTCNKGFTRGGTKCSRCKGTGVAVHKSGQDIITIPLPDDKADMYDLNKMRDSFSPPIELLRYMTEINDKYEKQIHKAVYNTAVLIQENQIAKTATEADYDMRNVYNVLTDYAVKCKSVWLTIAKFCATLTQTDDKVLFIYTNPIDWKLKTLSALYEERKAINDSGAPSFSKVAVDDDIAAIKLMDDTDAMLAYEVKKKFFPFPGKTAEETSSAMMQNYTPKKIKVLYQQFDYIFMQAELNNENFYIKSYSEQKTIIDKLVDEIIVELTPDTPAFPVPAPKPEPDPIEE